MIRLMIEEQELTFEVWLDRMYFADNPEEPVSWAAEWGVLDSSTGTEESGEDLPALVKTVVEDLRRQAGERGTAVRVVWTFSGDAPETGTVADAVTREGVTLPDRVLPA